MDSETARIEAFSDGVFAIAITLLILEIRVPSNPAEDLRAQLLRQWPSYVAFLLSFSFIGIMWINHHQLFTHIRHSNNNLLVLNLLLLLGVTVVPFTTALLASNVGHAGAHLALAVYNGTFVAIAILFNVLWRYASTGNRLLGKKFDEHSVDRISRQYAYGPLMYVVCFVVGWFSVGASLVLNIGLAIFFALPFGAKHSRTPAP